MLVETPAALLLRHAVRDWLSTHHAGPTSTVAVALSGGPDSLALTAATAAEAAHTTALIVDHQLQPDSAEVAAAAAAAAADLGCASVTVLPVVPYGRGGPEAAARRARYEALASHCDGHPVLLGHTLDDQAETVLLGLARGSGPRSIRGMSAYDRPWGRPLLTVRRETTRQLCADLDLTPHHDRHNDQDRFTRVRIRHEALPLLEDILAGGVAEALARTAEQLRDDSEVLDAWADEVVQRATMSGNLELEPLVGIPTAVRRRAIHRWLYLRTGTGPTDKHVRGVDSLIVNWHGQGPISIAGGRSDARLAVARRASQLAIDTWHTAQR